MAGTPIKIDDDYITSMGKMFSEWAGDLQAGVDSYLKIMNAIVSDAIMEGDTANTLRQYIGYASALKSVIESAGNEAKGLCVNYLSEVDQADSYLY